GPWTAPSIVRASWASSRSRRNPRNSSVVIVPTSTVVIATSATITMGRRALSDRGGHHDTRCARSAGNVRAVMSPVHGLQDVARAAHGVDHRLAAGVDLLAQVRDVELDDVRLATEVVVPHPVEDLRLAEDPPGVAHEVAQQLELGRGQVDRVVASSDLMAVL